MSRLLDAFILMFAVIGMGTVVEILAVKTKQFKERVVHELHREKG